MATTIDSLQIEIQSNSSGAAAGIESLATALGKLKANGAIGVAVKNLGKLSDALKQCSAVSSQAGKISSLADAVTKLSGAGSFAKVVNQLNKLPSALSGLRNVNLDGIDGKIDRIVSATGKLSSVKSGGFSTMVNSLSKLSSVTKSLDDATIDAFADRIDRLNTVLTPLSQKMTTVSAGFKAINSNAKNAGSGLGVVNSKINATALNLASLVTIVQGVISALRPIVALLSSVIGQAIEWDGIAARFGRGFGEQAEEVYNWVLRLNKEMGINVQQFMQYSSTYATMLTGFGVASKDASKMALGYMELTYDIWSGYNDIYKTMDEAASAVRSAIAGEVEPVRKAGFTIIESTLEQTAANHGLEISLEKATEAQKSYLRYLALVDQAHAQGLVGSYARELNTAEGLMRTFSQQLKSLAQTFGSLFLPILVKVMPWLQAFVDLLTDAIRAVAAFFGIEIQKVDWGGSSGLGGLGDSADSATGSLDDTAGAVDGVTDSLKDLKKATVGIDELNVISPPTSGAGSDGAGGGTGGAGSGSGFGDLDIDSLWDESIFDSIQSQVDDIKAKIQEWLPVIGTVGAALAGLGIATLLKNLGDALSMMNTLQKVCASLAILTIEAAIVFTLADNYLESGNLLNILGEALVTAAAGYLMFRAWGAGGATLALAVSIIAQLVAIEMNLADGTISLSSPELWIQALSTAVMGAFGGAIIASKTGFFAKEGFVIGLAASISLTMSAIRMGAIESGEIDSGSFEAWIMEAISVASAGLTGYTIGKAVFGVSGAKAGLLIGVTAGLVINLVEVIGVKGEDFGNNFSDWLNVLLTGGMTALTGAKLWSILGPTIKSALGGLVTKVGAWLTGGGAATLFAQIESVLAAIPVWGWIAAAVVALIAGAIALATVDYDFTEIGEKLGTALGWVFKYMTPIGWTITFALWVIDAFKGAIEYIKTHSWSEFWDDVWGSIVTGFSNIGKWWNKFVEAGSNIIDGIVDGITSGWDNLCNNLGEFFTGFWEGFCSVFGIASPAKSMIPIGKYIVEGILAGMSPTAIKDRLSQMWSTATKWFGVDKTLKVGISLVKSGWSTVKGWIGSIPKLSQSIGLAKSGWSTIKGWIGSIPKISQGIGLAKSGWSTVKKWIGNMPTLSAGIKLVKSGWTSISKWLGNLSYKLSFKLPKIGVKWSSKEVLGFKISYPSSFYTYAKGGFPDIGEMFIAREAGPEMVGRIGSKTTVANNEQIVEAVSEGVYSAVVAAMRASGGSNGEQAVNVYLDGRQITSVVEKRQSERGASIMGKQVYGY